MIYFIAEHWKPQEFNALLCDCFWWRGKSFEFRNSFFLKKSFGRVSDAGLLTVPFIIVSTLLKPLQSAVRVKIPFKKFSQSSLILGFVTGLERIKDVLRKRTRALKRHLNIYVDDTIEHMSQHIKECSVWSLSLPCWIWIYWVILNIWQNRMLEVHEIVCINKQLTL